MPFEIERKFLPKDTNWRPTGPCHVLRQGFFWLDEDSRGEVICGNERGLFRLTPRGQSKSFEFVLPEADALALGGLTTPHFSKHWYARIRESDGARYRLTLKGPSADHAQHIRPEFEYDISAEEGHALLALCAENHILKRRYPIPYQGYTWEIDVFDGPHTGLVLCEVEMQSADENPPRPDFIGREVTSEKAYRNVTLARSRKLPEISCA